MVVAEFTIIKETPFQIRSWISDLSDTNYTENLMITNNSTERLMCYHCRDYLAPIANVHRCRGCGRLFCQSCMESNCKLDSFCNCSANGFDGKLEDHENTKESPLLTLEQIGGSFVSPSKSDSSKIEQLAGGLDFSSPRSVDYEDDDESGMNYFTPSSSFSLDTTSDTDSISISTRSVLRSFKSFGLSPQDSPRKSLDPADLTPTSKNHSCFFDQDSPVSLQRSIVAPVEQDSTKDSKISVVEQEEKSQNNQPLIDFEGNKLIWYPPPPAIEGDDTENKFFEYDDDDDDSDSMKSFEPSSCDEDGFGFSNKSNIVQKEFLKSALHGHFRALVLQLLQGQGVNTGSENSGDSWLEIVLSLAWQAANFVKTDTSKGGSMDPGAYVKVKCIASGNPRDSNFVKGVVCTKNVKHKRMVSQHRNPRLLLLGGALEYQKNSNKLASLNTVLEQEKEHLKNTVAMIEAQRPNVLVVEKTASLYAQELLSKDISLVLNVKKPLLERISRCTGAQIASCTESIGSVRTGQCQVFRTERVAECLSENDSCKKAVKTLMFFEGCPRRLGCTVLLRGANREELKKVKHAVQFAVFAAYHLSLETSFLADEGATLPKIPIPTTIGGGDIHLRNGSSNRSPNGHCLPEPNFVQTDSTSTHQEEMNNDSAREESNLESNWDTNNNNNNNNLNGEQRSLYIEDRSEISSHEYFSTAENQQSILVSLSSTCALKGTVCEQSQLFRIKFYGSFDKPLGRYLMDDLFGQTSCCPSCNEPTESHVRCYTHQQGSLTISVRRLSSVKLPGERDGKIWMWHRCLRCRPTDEGVPPATPRVIMSNAAWGLSFGKFLELSFSNHATANRVASCGHSLQKDCLRFYGLGSMVAVFRYSPVDILSVNLPPSMLDFTYRLPLEWVREEANEICARADGFYLEVSDMLNSIEKNVSNSQNEALKTSISRQILELKEAVKNEKNKYNVCLQQIASESVQSLDSLDLDRWRLGLANAACMWDRRVTLLDSLSKETDFSKKQEESITPSQQILECNTSNIVEMDLSIESVEGYVGPAGLNLVSGQCKEDGASSPDTSSSTSSLSDKIDLAWTGSTDQTDSLRPTTGEPTPPADPFSSLSLMDNPTLRKALAPVRVHSFDSALKSYIPSRIDQTTNIRRAFSQKSPNSSELSPNPAGLSHDALITMSDEEPTSFVAHAMTSREYHDFISAGSLSHDSNRHTEIDEGGRGDHHFRASFEEARKSSYSVTCYFGREFWEVRRKCLRSEMDFVRSVSRCKRWAAQGGKSGAYFAKTADERFIVKQVSKTELDSFEYFAPEYFKYLTESLNSGGPTCLAKIVGIYQVVAKNLRGGKEMRMDFMVMENLFFGRNVSRIYDLKGSLRSRYNPDTSGNNKVLLDLNLLETLHTKPIFLGSKAKRRLERAIWNDTSFLASVGVMDYSLLVGIDEEKKELVIGIIDYLRQYTWDKQLETWVKTSGILGGPKNTPPTIISPMQYKKRFRKAMSKYFLTVPDQWSS